MFHILNLLQTLLGFFGSLLHFQCHNYTDFFIKTFIMGASFF